jgi:hypothetical protein
VTHLGAFDTRVLLHSFKSLDERDRAYVTHANVAAEHGVKCSAWSEIMRGLGVANHAHHSDIGGKIK